LEDFVILLADNRFNWKEGTCRTSFKAISLLKERVPVEFMGIVEPLGNLTKGA
jgi:hypothetical protein